jgi:hypothetical protein
VAALFAALTATRIGLAVQQRRHRN